jgi:hypothetical protein
MSQSHRRRRQRRTKPSGAQLRKMRRDYAQGLCAAAELLTSPIDLEQWASMLLGEVWERVDIFVKDGVARRAMAQGAWLLRYIAEVGGLGAAMALAGVERLDAGPLGARARELADRLEEVELPDWISYAGRVQPTRAMLVENPGLGELILLEAGSVEGPVVPHTLAVYIDLSQGGIAKHLALLQPLSVMLDPEARLLDLPGAPPPVEIDLARATARVRGSIELTDAEVEPGVTESYPRLRAIASSRVGPLVPAGALASMRIGRG